MVLEGGDDVVGFDRLAIMDEIEKITRIQQVFVLCIRVSLCIYA